MEMIQPLPGNLSALRQHSHAGVALFPQIFQRGKENQLIGGRVDHFGVIARVIGPFSAMIPPGFARLGAVQNRRVTASFNRFQHKKRIIEFDQGIIGNAYVLPIRIVMRQDGFDRQRVAGKQPVSPGCELPFGQRIVVVAVIIFQVYNVLVSGPGAVNVDPRRGLVVIACHLVAVVRHLIQSRSALAGHLQVDILYGRGKGTGSIHIHNIAILRIIERLHDPKFAGRKAGVLHVPVAGNCIGVIIHNGLICYRIVIKRIWQLLQIDLVTRHRNMDHLPVLRSLPGAAVIAGGASVTLGHLIERSCLHSPVIKIVSRKGDASSVLLYIRFGVSFHTPKQRLVALRCVVRLPVAPKIFRRQHQIQFDRPAGELAAPQAVLGRFPLDLDRHAKRRHTTLDCAGVRVLCQIVSAAGKIKLALIL